MLPLSPHDAAKTNRDSYGPKSHGRPEARRRIRNHLFGVSTDAQENSEASNPVLSMEHPKIDMQAAIALLQELRKTATQEDLVALHRALLPTVVESKHGPAEPKDRVEPANLPLIRRKSLFTPGEATRFASTKNLARSKTTHGDKETRKSQGTSGTMNDSYFGLKVDTESDLKARALTPSDFEYNQLGMHELGPLRVMNGAATPEPTSTPMLSQQPTFVKLASNAETSSITESFAPHPMSEIQDQMSSGSEAEANKQDTASAEDFSITDVQISSPKRISPTNCTRGIPNGPRQPLFSRRKTNDSMLSSTPAIRSPSMREMYASEATSDPFFMLPDSPQIDFVETVQDEDQSQGILEALFASPHSPPLNDCESTFSTYPRLDIKEILVAPSRAETAAIAASDRRLVERQKSSSRSSIAKSEKHSSLLSVDGRYSIVADSGYGSDTSSKARTLASRNANREHLIASGIVDLPVDQSTPCQELAKSGSATPFADFTPNARPKSTTSSSYNFSKVMPEEHPNSPPSDDKAISHGDNSPPSPQVLYPSSKKLKKKRPVSVPSSSNAYIQTGTASSCDVPIVPRDMAAKHAKRMSLNPGMEHLEHTFDSVSITDRDRSASPMRPAKPLTFPSPSHSMVKGLLADRGRKSRRQSLEKRQRSPRRLFRSKSRKRDESRMSDSSFGGDYDVGGNLADFGTVALSIGDSPYAAACTSVTKDRPYPSGPQTYAHPHQISSRPRTRSTVGMDEKSASEFAMQRSRDRMANMDEKSAALPTTIFSAKIDDRVPWPNRRPRPKSLYSKAAPPVPTLPETIRGVAKPRPKSAHSSDLMEHDEPYHRPSKAVAQQLTLPEPSSSMSRPHAKSLHSSKLLKHAELEYRLSETVDLQPTSADHHPRLALAHLGNAEAQVALQSSETQSADDWEQHARAWRSKRRSIGDNLLCKAYEVTGEVSIVSNCEKSTTSSRQVFVSEHECAAITKEETLPSMTPNLMPSQSVRSAKQPRPTSPAPSILARAALYERTANIGSIPMPPPFPGNYRTEKQPLLSPKRMGDILTSQTGTWSVDGHGAGPGIRTLELGATPNLANRWKIEQ